LNVNLKFRLRSRLGDVPANVDRIIEELLDESAERVAAKWKGGVRVRTGAYRDSIVAVKVGKRKRLAQSDVAHSVFNEYGTSRMAAKPDARQAAEREPAELRRSVKGKRVL
jgi:hypothetical protein